MDNVLVASTSTFVERQETVTTTATAMFFGQASTTTTTTTVTETTIRMEEFSVFTSTREELTTLNSIRPRESIAVSFSGDADKIEARGIQRNTCNDFINLLIV